MSLCLLGILELSAYIRKNSEYDKYRERKSLNLGSKKGKLVYFNILLASECTLSKVETGTLNSEH